MHINSISSRSISFTTIIPFFAKKCRDNSLVASLKIDFYIKTTLAPESAIFLTNFAIYIFSSFINLSIALKSVTTTEFSTSVFGALKQN